MRNLLRYHDQIIDSLCLCRGSYNDKINDNTNDILNVPKRGCQKIFLDNFEQRSRLKDMNLEVDKNGNIIVSKTMNKYESIVKNMIYVCFNLVILISHYFNISIVRIRILYVYIYCVVT